MKSNSEELQKAHREGYQGRVKFFYRCKTTDSM